jgi:pimeloyl-ACP methyl ester carboxylesterase
LSGPLYYYRNIDRNWETTKHLADRVVECPCLQVMTDRDPILLPEFPEGMECWVPRLRRECVKDSGHWTQQEKPEEVNRLLLEFLANPSG